MSPKLLSYGALALALIVPAAASAQLPTYVLTDQSVVRFECQGGDVEDPATGRFSAVNGRLSTNPQNLAGANGVVEVLLSSITSDSSAWDAMFRAAPFLALDEHPRARFELRRITGARALADGEWRTVQLEGRMTVHGVARDRAVPARIRWTRGDDKIEIHASFSLPWTEHRISVPTGRTRRFAGDMARVRIELVFRLRR